MITCQLASSFQMRRSIIATTNQTSVCVSNDLWMRQFLWLTSSQGFAFEQVTPFGSLIMGAFLWWIAGIQKKLRICTEKKK